MEQIVENSLFSNDTEKAALIADKEAVANAFFINFLGTLGLFVISSSRGIMKNYFADDGKLQIVNIGDANKDTSLATKLYHDIGGLKPDTANKITRLLVKMKSRAITNKTFDETVVRELIKEIQYLSHRPHPIILNVVKQYESGVADIKQVAKAFYHLIKARKRDFGAVSKEFYEIARQYQIYLKDVSDIGSAPSAAISNASTQTAVPHAAAGTVVVTPIAANVNQTPKATKIQTVAKPAAISEEDFYMLMWKARTAREINKLLKERGYDTFTPELMTSFMERMLPSTSDQVQKVEDTLTLMPSIEEFKKAFGYFMRSMPHSEAKYLLVLMYKVSMGKDWQTIKNDTIANAVSFKRLIKSNTRQLLAGKSADMLRQNINDSVLNGLHRSIVTAGPADDIEYAFGYLKGAMDEVSKSLYSRAWLDRPINFPKSSTLNLQEKIKFTLAFLSKKTPFTTSYLFLAAQNLKTLLSDANIEFVVSSSSDSATINIPNYENIFPNSKATLDSWFRNGSTEVTLGKLDIYNLIANKWERGQLEKNLTDNISLVENIPNKDVAVKLKDALINKIGSINYYFFTDFLSTLKGYQTSYWGSGDVNSRQNIIIRELQSLFFKEVASDIRSGKFKFEKDEYPTLVRYVFEMARFEFKKSNTIYDDTHWATFVDMWKSILSNVDGMSKELVKHALSYGAGADAVLQYANMSWEDVADLIISDDTLLGRSYPLELLKKPNIIAFMTPERIQKLKAGISSSGFLNWAESAKIDLKKYITQDSIFKDVEKLLLIRYNDPFQDAGFKYSIAHLDADNRAKIEEFILSKVMKQTSYGDYTVDMVMMNRYQKLVGEDRFREYVNSLNNDERQALLGFRPNLFFKYLSATTLDEHIKKMWSDPNSNKTFSKNEFIRGCLRRKDDLSVESIRGLAVFCSSYNRGMKPSVRREYEQYYYSSIELLQGKSPVEADKIFQAMPLQERRQLVGYIVSERYMADALEEVQGDNVLIKPLIAVSEERLIQIMKYNDIDVPRRPIVKDGDTLTSVLGKVGKVAPIKDLHVDGNNLTDEELERLSVEYDAFNRYAHGEIALKIKRSFNVSVPMQEKGFKEWIDQMSKEGQDARIMKPIFHGTGSIGASMILRYGFKIIKASDGSVVGRMLGDGIYFSNVLDKVAQYVGDEGFSRRFGTQGFIFEMEGSLGKHRRDFRCAGTGLREDERSTVSPEWAVFDPNRQLRIYKAYHVELISKTAMNEMKKKHLTTNESTAVEIKGFKQFINEGVGDMPHCITYVFMDGDIPVSEKQKVDFKEFVAKKFGKHVNLDWTGSGPSVMIYNRKASKTFIVRYTREFMENRHGELDEYLKLLNGK